MKHVTFVSPGPQTLDLQAHQSKCSLGLFVAQSDHRDLSIVEGQLGVVNSNDVLYPYSTYDLDHEDMDKQEIQKGDLEKHLN